MTDRAFSGPQLEQVAEDFIKKAGATLKTWRLCVDGRSGLASLRIIFVAKNGIADSASIDLRTAQ